ncbi:MAG TPA: hypothetical protein VF476_02565 [Chitinophagaceae bacterium]
MLIATGYLSPIVDFLQIICWIALPVFLLAWFTTALHHYVRKKRNAKESLDDEFTSLSFPETGPDGAYLHFDHTGLVQEFRNKLTYSHARYSVLKNDYDKLEKKYNSRRSDKDPILQSKINEMENINEQATVTSNSVNDEFYLKDLVEEKQAQIQFLQAQLEQRILKQHEAERSREQVRSELGSLRQLQEQHTGETARLTTEISSKQNELERIQHLLSEKEGHVIYTEAQLRETREQNELLNAAVADQTERSELLYRQLQEEQSKTAVVEEKLRTNKQLLQRLYKEFAACVEEEESSPVVPLRANYLVAEEA